MQDFEGFLPFGVGYMAKTLGNETLVVYPFDRRPTKVDR
jgi:hypothetical protein